MIGKLSGTFVGNTQGGGILLEVGGVGYAVRIAPSSRDAMRLGEPLELFIHTAVREDAIDLYGFPTEEELSFFKLLMSVSGVGPKTALGILTVADVPSLSRAVAAGDASILNKVYGIGKKSAERIVVELRDTLVKEQQAKGEERGPTPLSVDGEVLEALEALGYSPVEGRRALQSLPPELVGVRERLSLALKNLGKVAS